MSNGKTTPHLPLRCHTRALKNARHLKKHAPEAFAGDPEREGFGTGIALPLLRALHRMHPASPALRRHQAVADVLRAHPLPKVRPPKRDALFSGTIHFAQITFNTSGGSQVVSTADMNQIVAYAQHAIVPIQEYCSLYGQNHSTISTTLLTKTVTLSGTSFSEDDLKDWVNALKHDNGLGDDSCIFVVVPSGVSSKDVGGNSGYHDKADIPFIVAGVFATGLTLADSADVYAMVVSHEIAEMIVDPGVGGGDPEVCDPCDINCSNLTRIYFDGSDNFVGFNQATPPSGFTFAYYICAVVKPEGAADCPAASADCGYAPVDQACTLLVDKSTYGEDEVRVLLPGTAAYPNAYWVALDGFTGAELGIASFADLFKPTPSPAPVITVTADPLLNPGLTAAQIAAINANLPTVDTFAAPVVPTDPTLAAVTQRFLYPYTISFTSDAAFEQLGLDQSVTLTLTATMTVGSVTRSDTAALVLTKGENPFVTNVNPDVPTQPAWLSFDLRFFKVAVPAGGSVSRFGAAMTSNAADAPGFIASVLQNLTTGGGNVAGDSFENLEQDEERSALEFLQQDDADNFVFNFAVARVRLTGNTPGAQATNVRVFFRLLNAQTTGTDFDPSTSYRTASDGVLNGHKIALLGVRDDEYVTIPCFATQRVNRDGPADMSTQNDPPNAQTILVNPGHEVDTFFGCWLDINQPDALLPQTPPAGNADGPWNGIALSSINQAITRGPHQCLVAEISYDDTPIPSGADPGNTDKLAQRNIAWIDGPNPGLVESRRMPHPIEIKPTAPDADAPDELMIFWGNTPRGSTASLYLPTVNAADVLSLAGKLYASHRLSAEDAHTLHCPAEGVTFVPLPEGTAATAGLLTVELPPGIKKGDAYTIQVRQLTEAELEPGPILTRGPKLGQRDKYTLDWRRTTGQFQFNIVISTREKLLYREERLLAWLKWISLSIPAKNRWRAIWDRYLVLIGGRVDGFGGNPDDIQPSPTGTVPHPKPPKPPAHHHPHEAPCPEEERIARTGKVVGLVHDRFGDFEGFMLLDECGREHRYYAREHATERLVRTAWVERAVLTVLSPRHRPHEPAAIVVRRAPEPFQH